jgi:hypothetical protein
VTRIEIRQPDGAEIQSDGNFVGVIIRIVMRRESSAWM